MILAIMQPYFFPYVGYFQLIRRVDRFIVYDDVNYIKNGWINRNRILLGGQPTYITVPLAGASSFRPIRATEIDNRLPWREKLLKTIQHAYAKAPFLRDVLPMIESVLATPVPTISGLALASLKAVSAYLDLSPEWTDSSSQYENSHLRASERVLDICAREHATRYVNLPGGRALYDPDDFATKGIELEFLDPKPVAYRQDREEFVPWLSIIDLLMFNSRAETRHLLDQFDVA